ncbi:MAG: 5-bromo-4-chloroindolyl phosphate hydrolysis family protein [Chloroflexota bacterium]
MWKGIVSGVGGGTALAVAAIGFNVPLLIAIGAGGGVYAGLSLLLSTVEDPSAKPLVEGLSRGEAQRIIRDGERKLVQIRRLRRQIADRRIGRQVEVIIALGEKVFLNLRTDPKSVKAARRFLEYYLDATVLVIQRYVDLSKQAASNPEVQKATNSFAEALTLIQSTFERQYERLLRDDVLDFDTEVSVLKQLIRSDGP